MANNENTLTPAGGSDQRATYEAWFIKRQRAAGFAAQLSDEELLASAARVGRLEDGWIVWQAALASAPASAPLPLTDITALGTLDLFLANNPEGPFEVHAPDGDYLPISAELFERMISSVFAASGHQAAPSGVSSGEG